MPKPSELAAYGALVTAALVWGGSIVGQKFALGSLSAVEVSVLRGLGGLAILIPAWWWAEGGTGTLRRAHLPTMIALGVAVLGNHLLTLFGLRYISAASAGVIIGASPVITALFSSILIRDVPFAAVLPGCAVSFAGVALVSGVSGAAGQQPVLGGTLILLGLISWALYTVGSRKVMERVSPLTVNWTTLLIAIVLQIPLLWTDQRALPNGFAQVPPSAWLAVLFLVVFATAIGQQSWLYGVQGLGPSRAGVFVNLIPVSAVVLSALVLGDRIGAREMAGITLILLGVWLVNRRSSRV